MASKQQVSRTLLPTSKINFRDYEVNIICNPRLKNSYIRINPDDTITVKTPYRSNSFALEFLEEKRAWVEKQMQKNAMQEKLEINLEDEVLLFGERYSIDASEAEFLRKKLHRLKTSSHEKIMKCYDIFYKEQAREYLTKRTEYFASIMKLKYKDLKFRKMKSRWGSCSSLGVLTFNSELMKLEKRLVDYVVVHELAHLVHMNHSKSFHALVDVYIKGSKEIRKRLKAVRIAA